jgi:CheY-like chemotaxis protein
VDRLRVLVVDDDPDGAELLSLLLEQLGHESRRATSGREALHLATTYEPDVVFLDIGLPDMTGYAVALAMRERPRGTEIYIAALTGWGRADDIRQAHASGIDRHITKPADRATLADTIAAARSRRRA